METTWATPPASPTPQPKKYGLIAAAFVLIALAIPVAFVVGRSSNEQAAPTTTTTTTTTTTLPDPKPAPQPQQTISRQEIAEEAFVRLVRGEAPWLDMSDAEIIDGGYMTCEALDSGMTPGEIILIAIEAAQGNPEVKNAIAALSGGATGILCPEWADVWDF